MHTNNLKTKQHVLTILGAQPRVVRLTAKDWVPEFSTYSVTKDYSKFYSL